MSSKNFILLALTFTSLIHFKFISVYGIKYKVGIQLYSFTYEYQVSPAIFVEPHSFIHWIVLHPLCKSISFQHIHKCLLLGSLLYFIGWCLFLCKCNTILLSAVSSVTQSCSTFCNPMHTRPPCPSPTPGACSTSCPWSVWCHPTISSVCRPLLPPSIFPSNRVFSNELAHRIRWPKYWSFSFSISPPNEYSGLISFRIDWFDLLIVQGTLKSLLQNHSSKASILWHSAFFFMVQLSHPYMTTGKTKVLTIWTS